jgi:UDPglucose 6-dehydrogenase
MPEPPTSGSGQSICIIGIWHQGAVAAACLADAGLTVIGVDFDSDRVEGLNHGKASLYEPGLDELLAGGIASGRLTFTTSLAEGLSRSQVVFLMFDTPVDEHDEVDLSPIWQVADEMGRFLQPNSHILVTAQVPVGTCDKIAAAILKTNPKASFGIAYSPENLRLGQAIELYRHPQLPVIGSDDPQTLDRIESVLTVFTADWTRVGLRTAEMTKHALNAFLAVCVTFGNEIADISDEVGADAEQVMKVLRKEQRVGPRAMILPGLGFAGGTLARDVKTLQHLGQGMHQETALLDGVWRANKLHNGVVLRQLQGLLGSLEGTKVGLLGLTYKVGTSTLRRSLAIEVGRELAALGAHLSAYDPKADPAELGEYPEIEVVNEPQRVANDADAMVLMTPWPEFKKLDFAAMAEKMHRRVLLDPNNFLDPGEMRRLGYTYLGVGRGKGR